MADKRFGVRELIVLGSGTPTITSPSDLNLNANTVAISTDITIGAKIGLGNPVDYGTANQVLTSNGPSAAPTWKTVSGTSASAAGQTGAIQFKNGSGNFDGDVNILGINTGSRSSGQGLVGIGTDITDASGYATERVINGVTYSTPSSLVVKGDDLLHNGIQIITSNPNSNVNIGALSFVDDNLDEKATLSYGKIPATNLNQIGLILYNIGSQATDFQGVNLEADNVNAFYSTNDGGLDLGKSTKKWKDLYVGGIRDKDGDLGSAGQVLSSTGTELNWIDAASGGSGGSSDPVGTIVVWAGSAASIPSEYQLCDGSAAQTTELQAITGANVPDLRDRFIVGASDSTGDNTYPGLSPNATPGGSANATLVSHNHGSGTLSGSTKSLITATKVFEYGGDAVGAHGYTNTSTTISGSTSYAGSSATNANLPPYYALCYIIKHTAGSGSGGGGGTGTLTDVDVKQYADENTPRTEYGCSNPIEVTVNAGIATIGIGSTSNAFGKRYVGTTEPTSDVCDGDIWYDTSPSSGGGFVTGMIMMFSGTTAPTGWVLCDNSTEAQAANAPDLRDRFIVGTGNSYNLNDTGGSANAVLIAHNHGAGTYSITGGNHTHTYTAPNTLGEDNAGVANNPGPDTETDDTGGTGEHSHTISGSSATVGIDTAGNSSNSQTGTNANLPPYYALAFIMKT